MRYIVSCICEDKKDNHTICVFKNKTDNRRDACLIAFDELKRLTVEYTTKGTKYSWQDDGDEMFIETQLYKHTFKVISMQQHLEDIAVAVLLILLIAAALIGGLIIDYFFFPEILLAAIVAIFLLVIYKILTW